MAFIGYSSEGYESLAAEIRSRKSNLIDLLNSFTEVQQAITECWKGNDADKYKEDLEKLIESTRQSVTSTYDAMSNQFQRTHEEWVAKQNATNGLM